MLLENDVVRLKHDIAANSPTAWPGVPSNALSTGILGTIVMLYPETHTDAADHPTYEYEVEFVDNDGYTLALLTLTENDIERVE